MICGIFLGVCLGVFYVFMIFDWLYFGILILIVYVFGIVVVCYVIMNMCML